MPTTRTTLLAAVSVPALLLAACVLASPLPPSQAAPRQEPAAYTTPLGIALETLPYPHPVKFLSMDVEGGPVRFAYMDVAPTGTANGRAIVLLHGKNFYGSYWEGTIRALTAAGFRVVVPDQIGFGKSSKPDIPYSFDLLAANTIHLLDTLNIPQVAVVGHSMGGMLAVRLVRAMDFSA